MPRFTVRTDERALPLHLADGSTVEAALEQLNLAELGLSGITETARPRFIYGGRFLELNEILESVVPEDGVLHCVVSSRGVTPNETAESSSSEDDEEDEEEDEDEDEEDEDVDEEDDEDLFLNAEDGSLDSAAGSDIENQAGARRPETLRVDPLHDPPGALITAGRRRGMMRAIQERMFRRPTLPTRRAAPAVGTEERARVAARCRSTLGVVTVFSWGIGLGFVFGPLVVLWAYDGSPALKVGLVVGVALRFIWSPIGPRLPSDEELAESAGEVEWRDVSRVPPGVLPPPAAPAEEAAH